MMSLLTSLLTSHAAEVGLGMIEVMGVERRRRWPEALKLSILAEVNTGGRSLADVARRHDVTRQHIYQWRRELRAKGLLPGGDVPTFLAVDLPSSTDIALPGATSAADIVVVLRGGRHLRCREAIAETKLARLIQVIELA